MYTALGCQLELCGSRGGIIVHIPSYSWLVKQAKRTTDRSSIHIPISFLLEMPEHRKDAMLKQWQPPTTVAYYSWFCAIAFHSLLMN